MCDVKLQAGRFVTDRYEWTSLARSAPSVYHSWEWAEQSRRRVAHLVPHLAVSVSYFRLWVDDDALIAVPVLTIDGMHYNVPRSEPHVLEGGPVDDLFALIDDAADADGTDIEFVDDTEQLDIIRALEWDLQADADDYRARRTLADTDVAEMRSRLRFADDDTADCWFDAVKWVDRSGLDVSFVEYRRNDEPIGWAVYAVHNGDAEVLAAAHAEFHVPPWTSLR